MKVTTSTNRAIFFLCALVVLILPSVEGRGGRPNKPKARGPSRRQLKKVNSRKGAYGFVVDNEGRFTGEVVPVHQSELDRVQAVSVGRSKTDLGRQEVIQVNVEQRSESANFEQRSESDLVRAVSVGRSKAESSRVIEITIEQRSESDRSFWSQSCCWNQYCSA